jgi:hypothetical protein
VDTEPVGAIDTIAVTQDLMNRWNGIAEAEDAFGTASPGGPYNGSNVGTTFGVFTNTQYEVAFDDTGDILSHFGVSGVLGITLKTVDADSGRLLDFLVVVNTQTGALSAPGSGATAEQLLRATLLHELGHALGFAHTPVGMTNSTSFGLDALGPQFIPTMYPFRLPSQPQEGGTLEADDRAAAVVAYPGATAGLGSISGTVRALSGAAANEIAVRAVGDAGHVGTLTNTDGTEQGRFTIRGLPPGGYRVLLETVNGRGGVSGASLEGTPGSLGGEPFLHAADEYWQPGDTYDPAVDEPFGAVEVQVRGGRDTGGVDFVLDAAPLLRDDIASGALEDPDSRLPVGASFRFVDYFVFHGTSGQSVTLTANGSFTPQLRLLRPDLAVAAEALPSSGFTTALSHTLTRTGVHTVALFARGAAAGPNGGGSYTLRLQGAGGALPAPPATTAADAAVGPNTPGAREIGSPTCDVPVLQLRLRAPSHEELWVDRVLVRAFGSADDARDVVAVSLAHDRDGNGARNSGEPVLATAAFGADDGTLVFDDLAFEVDAGATEDLLLLAQVDVTSVSSAGFPAWIFLPVLLLLVRIRPRRALLLLLLCAVLPLSCGGGGGGGGQCGQPFDADGAIVTLQLVVEEGGIVAFSSTSTAPLDLPGAAVASAVLSVSN